MNDCFVVYWREEIDIDCLQEYVKTFDDLVDAIEYARELGDNNRVRDIKVFNDYGWVCTEIIK